MKKYFNPKNYFNFLIMRVFPHLLRGMERQYLEKYSTKESWPPIFIIGAPRTGSTILYQILTAYWNLGYINNLECKLHKNILCGALLSNKLFHGKNHSSFTAYHGSTKGLKSPSECGSFWYRWFPTDRHFVNSDEVENSKIEEMKKVVHGIIAFKDKPLIFKNLNCGQRLRVLAKAFPNALFIFCRRDPLYTSQSILRSKIRVYGHWNKWWSIMPKEYPELLELDPIEQAVAQVYYLEKRIKKDLNKLFPQQHLTIKYENFVSNPNSVLKIVQAFWDKNKIDLIMNEKNYAKVIECDNKQKLDEVTFKKIKTYIEKYFNA